MIRAMLKLPMKSKGVNGERGSVQLKKLIQTLFFWYIRYDAIMIDNVNQYKYYCIRKMVIYMATVPTQIRIDSNIKREANDLFDELGIDMSSAVNIFLRQCVMRGGLPFKVEVPQYSDKLLAAANEARRISRDSSIKGYKTMDELKKALED